MDPYDGELATDEERQQAARTPGGGGAGTASAAAATPAVAAPPPVLVVVLSRHPRTASSLGRFMGDAAAAAAVVAGASPPPPPTPSMAALAAAAAAVAAAGGTTAWVDTVTAVEERAVSPSAAAAWAAAAAGLPASTVGAVESLLLPPTVVPTSAVVTALWAGKAWTAVGVLAESALRLTGAASPVVATCGSSEDVAPLASVLLCLAARGLALVVDGVAPPPTRPLRAPRSRAGGGGGTEGAAPPSPPPPLAVAGGGPWALLPLTASTASVVVVDPACVPGATTTAAAAAWAPPPPLPAAAVPSSVVAAAAAPANACSVVVNLLDVSGSPPPGRPRSPPDTLLSRVVVASPLSAGSLASDYATFLPCLPHTCPSVFVGALLGAWPVSGCGGAARGPARRAAAAVLLPANAVAAGIATGATPPAEARLQALLHLAVPLLVRGAVAVDGRPGRSARPVVRVLLALMAAAAAGGAAADAPDAAAATAGEGGGGEGERAGGGTPALLAPPVGAAPSPTAPVDPFIDGPLRALFVATLPRTLAEVCDALDRAPVAPLSWGGSPPAPALMKVPGRAPPLVGVTGDRKLGAQPDWIS
ncbi:hypothetical protein I4F81_006078 [Pyropia yezoensis]|uniref:Uncharacterized protein n=1 Tax=Pyropia yezoensis TaxID=2788 RepID=A0ACC3C179_PYRYE|nr:hypothetical protein I4F81_006078 [Neopyropia yezoensis]